MFRSFYRSIVLSLAGFIARLLRGNPQTEYERIAFDALVEGGKTFRRASATEGG